MTGLSLSILPTPPEVRTFPLWRGRLLELSRLEIVKELDLNPALTPSPKSAPGHQAHPSFYVLELNCAQHNQCAGSQAETHSMF